MEQYSLDTTKNIVLAVQRIHMELLWYAIDVFYKLSPVTFHVGIEAIVQSSPRLVHTVLARFAVQNGG